MRYVITILFVLMPLIAEAHGVGLPHIHEGIEVDWSPLLVLLALVLFAAAIAGVVPADKKDEEKE